MAGRFDLAGVGPGDPELMTIKTIRAIKACQVLVLPIGSPELKKPELEEFKKYMEEKGKMYDAMVFFRRGQLSSGSGHLPISVHIQI